MIDFDVGPDTMIANDVRMLEDMMLDVAVGMLSDTHVIAITLEFGEEIKCTEDMLTDVSAVAITNSVPGTDVGILNDENKNGLTAVILRLVLALSPPWKNTIYFCWSALSRWSMAGLDLVRALQARIPSCHVC